MAPSSSQTPTPITAPMADLDTHLQAQESEVARELEVARVLGCPARDYFAILQINPLAEHASLAAVLRKSFRQKSLQIHPDRVKHKDAPRAFDLLKKANLVLSADPPGAAELAGSPAERGQDGPAMLQEQRSRYAQKENLVLLYRQIADGLGAAHVDDFEHATNRTIRRKVLDALEQHEKNLAVESDYSQRQEARKQLELKTAAKERELKRSWETRWEQDRDTRVKLWRSFAAKVAKPKKKKKPLV